MTRAHDEEVPDMLLAEALAERSDLTREIESLRSRVVANARYQEGERPAEDAVALLQDLHRAVDRLETLLARINRTNATAPLGAGTVTDALARREALRLRHSVLVAAADAGSGHHHRQLRSELKVESALPVTELRRDADVTARSIREIDLAIQRANWQVDLVD